MLYGDGNVLGHRADHRAHDVLGELRYRDRKVVDPESDSTEPFTMKVAYVRVLELELAGAKPEARATEGDVDEAEIPY